MDEHCVRMGWRRWLKVAAIGLIGIGGIWVGWPYGKSSHVVAQEGGEAAERRPQVTASSPLEAGRYLVQVGGCNDCHTAGYLMTLGAVPEEQWLLGDPMGWRGPWGTTYPSNLRLFAQNYDEEMWVAVLRERRERPPMPWMNLHVMSDEDLKAIFQYIRHLGPAGEEMPEWVPPGREPLTPYLSLVPQMPEGMAPPGEE